MVEEELRLVVEEELRLAPLTDQRWFEVPPDCEDDLRSLAATESAAQRARKAARARRLLASGQALANAVRQPEAELKPGKP